MSRLPMFAAGLAEDFLSVPARLPSQRTAQILLCNSMGK